MIRNLLVPFVLTVAVLAPACGDKAPATEQSENAATTGDSIGIPECDEFLAKYHACLTNKVPQETRATLAQSFDQMRSAWRATASTADGKAGLAVVCTQARQASKAAMGAYGCEGL